MSGIMGHAWLTIQQNQTKQLWRHFVYCKLLLFMLYEIKSLLAPCYFNSTVRFFWWFFVLALSNYMQKPGSVRLTLHSLCGQPCMEFTSYFYTLSNTTFCIQSNNSLNHHTPTVKPLTVWQCLKTTYATWSCSLSLDFALLHIWHKINNNILFATFLMPSYKPEDLCKLSEAFLRRFPLQVSITLPKSC